MNATPTQNDTASFTGMRGAFGASTRRNSPKRSMTKPNPISVRLVRIHASNGYSQEYPIERFYRDAPLMVVGEGTNEIQRSIIARQLVERGGLPYA